MLFFLNLKLSKRINRGRFFMALVSFSINIIFFVIRYDIFSKLIILNVGFRYFKHVVYALLFAEDHNLFFKNSTSLSIRSSWFKTKFKWKENFKRKCPGCLLEGGHLKHAGCLLEGGHLKHAGHLIKSLQYNTGVKIATSQLTWPAKFYLLSVQNFVIIEISALVIFSLKQLEKSLLDILWEH